MGIKVSEFDGGQLVWDSTTEIPLLILRDDEDFQELNKFALENYDSGWVKFKFANYILERWRSENTKTD